MASRYVDPYHDYQAQARANRSKDRHERAEKAKLASGGRSAPFSANDTTPSALAAKAAAAASSPASGGTAMPLTADDIWRLKFPKAPEPQPFISRPPILSARDSAIMASGWQQPVQFAPPPVMPDDMDNKAAMAIYHQAMRDYAASNRGKRNAGPPQLDPLSMKALSPTARTLASNASRPVQPMDLTAARAELYQRLPAVFEEGTPENAAFVQHAREFGEESAFRNIDDLIAPPPLPEPTDAETAAIQSQQPTEQESMNRLDGLVRRAFPQLNPRG